MCDNIISRLSISPCHFSVLDITMSFLGSRYHHVISQLLISPCHFSVLDITMSFLSSRYHQVISRLSISPCHFSALDITMSFLSSRYHHVIMCAFFAIVMLHVLVIFSWCVMLESCMSSCVSHQDVMCYQGLIQKNERGGG